MFAAIVTRAARTPPQDHATGDALLAALFPFAKPDVAGVWNSDHALIAHGVIHNTPESLHERAPEVCPETGRVIASWVRLDNREELCAQLEVAQRPDLTDPQIILAAHRTWGTDCADRLEGDFSFVIHDPASGDTFCARDAIGAKPFYYVVTDKVFIAATSIAAIKAVETITLTPSLKWIALFAAGMTFAHDQGAYQEVRKLPPAHDMLVRDEGQPELREYFTFDLTAPHATRCDPKWAARHREAFDRAVAVRARSHFLVGADSSGGLDSASVVASLVERLPHAREDFHVFAMLGMEREPELVEAVSQMCGVQHTHTLLQPELLRIDGAFHRALTALGHPPEHGQLLIHPEFFDIFREHGIRTIQSGYGGDEVVTSYSNHLIDELHHRRAYRAMFGQMHGSLHRRAGRFAKRIWRGPDDPDVRARGLMDVKLAVGCLDREFLEETGLGDQIERWFCPARPELTLNTYAALEPGFRYGRAGRLESSAIYGASYGVEYRFPMFDRKLVQQFFAAPSIEKRHQDMGRLLHRRAMEGRIPRTIQWQKSKDLGGFIGGNRAQQAPPDIGFDELPAPLRAVLDRDAFEQTMTIQRSSPDDSSQMATRRRFFMWQVRQLSEWLDME